jgi:hypothetical protein
MSRRAGLAVAVCVTGLLAGGVPVAGALEIERPSVNAACEASGSSGGGRKGYRVEPGGRVDHGAEGAATVPVVAYRVQVTVRLKERFGTRWTKRPAQTLRSELQYTSDDEEWPVYRRRWNRRQGKAIKEVKGTATLKLLNEDGAVVDITRPLGFRSIYDPRLGMGACFRGGSTVTSERPWAIRAIEVQP